VAVAQVHGNAVLAGDLLHPLGNVGEEWIGRVEHQVRDRATAAGAKMSPGLVSNETQLGDGPLHLATGRVADGVRTVEDVGHGSDRDPSTLGDIFDTCRRSSHRFSPSESTLRAVTLVASSRSSRVAHAIVVWGSTRTGDSADSTRRRPFGRSSITPSAMA